MERLDGRTDGRPCRAVAGWRHRRCRCRPRSVCVRSIAFEREYMGWAMYFRPRGHRPPADVSRGNGSPRVTAVATRGRVHLYIPPYILLAIMC
jgi:hypothetical protein